MFIVISISINIVIINVIISFDIRPCAPRATATPGCARNTATTTTTTTTNNNNHNDNFNNHNTINMYSTNTKIAEIAKS